jgi:hypothetical protein
MESSGLMSLLFNITLYLGIVGFLMFSFSFLSGLRIIKVKAKYRLHKRVGIIGFTAMFIHGVSMLYFNFFT